MLDDMARVELDNPTGTADILFIGQNPGEREVEQGHPFIGPSGKLLRKCLEELDQLSITYALTNAVKYYTPDNRKPTTLEIRHCRPELEADIAEVRPTLLVALGDVALFALTERKGVSKLNGTILMNTMLGNMGVGSIADCADLPVAVCFHPSWVLHGNPEQDFEAGLLPVLTYFSDIGSLSYKTVSSFPAKGLWALDLETTGLRPNGVDINTRAKTRTAHDPKIRCVGISNGKKTLYSVVNEDK